jgi:AhpD family alkylhydroperoxidase
VPNLHRILAESSAALEAYSTLWNIAEKTSFTPQERNIAYLAIIYENECTYCMAGHTNLSRMAKVAAAAIAAVREGRPIPDAKLEALRQFAAKVTRRRGVVSEADVATFKAAGYDNRAVLDVLVLAATAPGKLKPAA